MASKELSKMMFNDMIKSYILFSLNNLNILNFLKKNKKSTFQSIIKNLNLKSDSTKYLLETAKCYNILNFFENEYSLSEIGEELFQNIGFFTWAIGGYGKLLESIYLICKDKNIEKDQIKGDFVAQGSNECYTNFMEPILFEAIKSIPLKNLADLGCGNAGKLIQFAKMDPLFHGIGIDINQEAIDLANKNVKKNNLEERIKLYCTDVLDIINSKLIFSEVEVITSFMMMHDFFNIPNLSFEIFNKLKFSFPNAKYFIIGDTVASPKSLLSIQNEIPIFTMGFELIHKMLKIKLFEIDYYLDVFKKANLTLIQQIPFGVPNTFLFILKK